MSTLGHIFNKTQRRLMTLLFTNPNESFYTTELVQLVGTGTSTVTNELKQFRKSGILTTKKVGNQIHYQANTNSPIYRELKSLVRKTFGVTESFKEALYPIHDKIDKAFIYGSFANGTENAESDIDLMVITDKLRWEDVIDHIDYLGEELMRNINPTIYTKAEFKEKLDNDHYFISKVMDRPQIELI